MKSSHDETVAAIALGLVFGSEPGICRSIFDNLQNASTLFALDGESLDRIFGPFSGRRRKISGAVLDEAEEILQSIGRKGYRFLPFSDSDFPALLKDCPDSPPGLYIRSSSDDAEVFGRKNYVSIVGTRDISPYGSQSCKAIVDAFGGAEDRPAIVSGFAFGVDICAHTEALNRGLPTIAVLPTGIDSIYPRSHAAIADRMASTPGCALVTDFPPGTAVQKFNFLRRNRIIAGLSRAVILIESKAKGGGMMTSRLASGYGREVFAVGGRMGDIRSEGCNMLIKEKIAENVLSPSSLAMELGLCGSSAEIPGKLEKKVEAVFGKGDIPVEEAIRVADAVRSCPGITGDELCRKCNLSFGRICGIVSLLETGGILRRDLLGSCYLLW